VPAARSSAASVANKDPPRTRRGEVRIPWGNDAEGSLSPRVPVEKVTRLAQRAQNVPLLGQLIFTTHHPNGPRPDFPAFRTVLFRLFMPNYRADDVEGLNFIVGQDRVDTKEPTDFPDACQAANPASVAPAPVIDALPRTIMLSDHSGESASSTAKRLGCPRVLATSNPHTLGGCRSGAATTRHYRS
jgi:hypothetical protein